MLATPARMEVCYLMATMFGRSVVWNLHAVILVDDYSLCIEVCRIIDIKRVNIYRAMHLLLCTGTSLFILLIVVPWLPSEYYIDLQRCLTTFSTSAYIFQSIIASVEKKLKFSVLVGTVIKSPETGSWDETRTECMHFNETSVRSPLKQVCITIKLLIFCGKIILQILRVSINYEN